MLYSSKCVVILRAWKPSQGLHPEHFAKRGRVAQLAEHSALNRQVVGSIPTASTRFQGVSELGEIDQPQENPTARLDSRLRLPVAAAPSLPSPSRQVDGGCDIAVPHHFLIGQPAGHSELNTGLQISGQYTGFLNCHFRFDGRDAAIETHDTRGCGAHVRADLVLS